MIRSLIDGRASRIVTLRSFEIFVFGSRCSREPAMHDQFFFTYDFGKKDCEMGGTGSGRQGGYGADTTEDFPVLYIRWLKRGGALKPGTIHQISHLRRGKLTGSIALEAHEGKVTLAYCFGRDGEEFETRVYDIHLTQTPCGLGGERLWFLCPTPTCRRRVAILYGHRTYVCRTCRGLAYPSQREDACDRAGRRADKIRSRLGWKPGILNTPSWKKPKGMHWTTFERLVESETREAKVVVQGLRRFLGQYDAR